MPTPVSKAYKEISHYTTAIGLSGILSSQSLWATHSSFLNDSNEIVLFFDRRLKQLVEAAIRSELAASPDLQVLPQFARSPEEAEKAILQYVSDLASSMRKTTLMFNEPYITSFCPVKDDLQTDGLLSQWRGYGKDGGYAIVFDTARLEELLFLEGKEFWYQNIQWGDVYYHPHDPTTQPVSEDMQEAENALQAVIRSYILNPVTEELEPIFEPLATLSCLYKDWGFREEQELRIVAIPPNQELAQTGPSLGETRPFRPTKTFVRGGCPIPYIGLFDQLTASGVRTRLPITRVIVGPHVQKDLRKRAVETMLRTAGIDAEVVVSRIPYIGA